jgi:hypothetical protein
VSFAAISLYVASQRVFIVVHFVIESVQKLLDRPSYDVLTIVHSYQSFSLRFYKKNSEQDK